MENKPLLSIVTSIYNGGKALEQFLYCISNQTYSNIEVILIDDCSTDEETLEILKRLENKELPFNKSFKLIRNEVNLGLMQSFQKGLDNATGEYFAFPESDDLLDLDFYENLMYEVIVKKADVVKGLLLYKYTVDQPFRDNPETNYENPEIIVLFDKEVLPIAIKNSNGRIMSYLMPDITYSWFYVFNRKILSDGHIKPMFQNAVQYGFSNASFNMNYKESKVPLYKSSFYYYNSRGSFKENGCLIHVDTDKQKNDQIVKLSSEKILLEQILKRYNIAIDQIKEFKED